MTDEYFCHVCGFRKKVGGREDDGPIVVKSVPMQLKVIYSCSRVKNIADTEIRHVVKEHGIPRRQGSGDES